MTRIDYAIIAAGAFLCWVMATAIVDEGTIRDGLAVENGLMQLQEAGRK